MSKGGAEVIKAIGCVLAHLGSVLGTLGPNGDNLCEGDLKDNMGHSRRSHSFTKSFLSPEICAQYAEEWSYSVTGHLNLFNRGQIGGAELCARVVLCVHQSLFGKLWRNGERKPLEAEFAQEPEFMALNQIAKYKVRSLPDSAAQALLRWGRGQIQLKVFRDVPSPEVVLNLQSQGIRCVSVISDKDQIKCFRHEGRDFYSFLIHDLIHAQLMTELPESFQDQVKFAIWLKKEWAKLLSENLSLEGRAELEYMASDMNSHIVHLIKTFRSWIERHRPDLLDRTNWIGHSSFDAEFLGHWQRINDSSLDPNEQQRLHINMLELWKKISFEAEAGSFA